MHKPKDVNEYIAGFPKEIQAKLEQMRATIKKAAPDAEEVISYGMPGYKLKGSLVWFGGHTSHIGFYPKGSSALNAFKKELSGYKSSKGAVQFPLNEPLPLDLVTKMVKYRVKENLGIK
jgi:uncharacterized protein YdhG (YjbR/CyaY superfamily)